VFARCRGRSGQKKEHDYLKTRNGLEDSWSLLKRGIKGTYVSVKPYHLYRYLDEQAFRFNERDGEDKDRFAKALGDVAGRRATYDELTGRQGPG
jgi:hypothetical protein